MMMVRVRLALLVVGIFCINVIVRFSQAYMARVANERTGLGGYRPLTNVPGLFLLEQTLADLGARPEKPRDWDALDNIKAEIATLNRLRKAHPALQSHLGVTFYNAFNPNILYYGKHIEGEKSRILVAVSLDPGSTQECDFEIPLWEWDLPDSGALFAEDLLSDRHFVWHGKIQHLHLTPDAPYRIWRVCPAEDQ